MENFDISELANSKAKRIAQILSEKYDSADFEVYKKKINIEAEQRCDQEVKAYFILNTEAKFDTENIETLNICLSQRVRNKKTIDKMNIEEKLSFFILCLTEDYLLKNDRILRF